jgi:ribonucleoside-diphosphate reductase alpha chain
MLLIAENAWLSGDPGIFFIDRANEDNMVPYLGRIEATNPCGEVPLLAHEPCCLGSINLERFVEGKYVDFAYLEEVVRLAVRFLDNVHDVSHTQIDEINNSARRTRRIGLGVMGWADMLAELGLAYDHEDAFILADIVSKIIQKEAWLTSMDLAEERGAFPAFLEEEVNWNLIDKLGLDRRPVRNVAVTSIAPTGSISLISDVNSGIEPFFSHHYTRNITEGIGNRAIDTLEQSAVSDSVKTAHEIHWKDHIRMQAAWQKWTCNAVSKTINMPNDASVDDIMEAYALAWELGCKGITVYRNGSRMFQILEPKEKDDGKNTKVL